MSRFEHKIFITGATGNLGSKLVLQALEERSDTQIIVLVRGEGQTEAEIRLRNLLFRLSPKSNFAAFGKRLKVISGDITQKQLGIPLPEYNSLAKNVTHIIHCAAGTKFNSTLEESRLVNYAGTENVMKFAALASKSSLFKTAAHISTAFVCGRREGIIFEDETDKSGGFSNGYEQSKWEAEQLVRGLMPQIPLTIFRPSIIVGDSQTGRIATFNVLYPPLKFLCQGLNFSLLEHSDTLLDVIPVDYAARVILHIMLNNNSDGKTFHIVAGKENSCQVAQIVKQAQKMMGRENSNSDRNRPSSQTRRASRISQFLSIYMPHVTLRRYFDNTNTRKILQGSGICAPLFLSYLDKIMEYSIGTNWGKNVRSAA